MGCRRHIDQALQIQVVEGAGALGQTLFKTHMVQITGHQRIVGRCVGHGSALLTQDRQSRTRQLGQALQQVGAHLAVKALGIG